MTDPVTPRTWLTSRASWMATAMMLLAVAPFLVLARFAHPSADDYCSANQMRDMGLLGSFNWFWTNWTGRYVAAITQNFSPLAFGSFAGYKLVAPALIVVLFLAILWLVSELTREWLQRSRAVGASLGVLAVFLFGMPSVVEGLYWYTGVIIFTVGAIFVVATFAAALRSARSVEQGRGTPWLAIAIAFDVLATGSNEPLILILGLVHLFLSWRARVERRPSAKIWQAMLITTIVAGIVSVTSPGNFARGTQAGASTHIVGPLVGSIVVATSSFMQWMSSAPSILGALLVLWAGVERADDLPADSPWRRTPWPLAAVVTLLAIWLPFFFTHWASGMTLRPGPPGRVMNEVWLLSMFGVAVTLFMAGVQQFGGARPHLRAFAGARGWLVLLFAVSLFGAGNVREGYMDLATGRAAAFDREMVARYERVRDSGGANPVILAPVTRTPTMLFFHDLEPEDYDWRNYCFAKYWNVPRVIVRK